MRVNKSASIISITKSTHKVVVVIKIQISKQFYNFLTNMKDNFYDISYTNRN